MRASLALCLLAACGGATPERRPDRRLDDDAIEAFGATRADPEPRAASEPRAPLGPIELAGGETLRGLVALVRFEAGESGALPHCALYALRAESGGLEEGRRSVACETAAPDADVPLAPVEAERDPVLRRALAGATLATAPAGDVRLYVTTDRRLVEGHAATPRWPSPAAEDDEPFVARSPENLTELWEAVMYPHRYRP
jgi:hypothetical protein